MYLQIGLFSLFVFVAYSQSNFIIRDYFIHKNVSMLVGFSCGDATNDFQTIRMLNNEGIPISIKGPSTKYDFSKFLNVSNWKVGVFVDLRCQQQNATFIFNQSTTYHMYDYAYNWLILTRNINDCLSTLNDDAFSVVTDFVVSVPSSDHYDLYDIYNPFRKRGGKLNITKYGTWKKDIGLKVLLLGTKISRRWNLHKIKVNVSAALEWKPKEAPLFEYLTNHDTTNKDIWPTIGIALLLPLSDIFNFSMNVHAFTSWKNYTNGPVVDALAEGTVDMGYQPSLILHRRLNLAKVVMEVLPVRTCFMFITVPSTKIQISSVLRPLSWSSWYMIALLFVISFFVFVITLKLEGIENQDYGNSLLTILGALCQQGAQSVPHQFAGRIVFLQIGLYCLLVYNYYSAAIVSARLNTPLNKMNDSLYTLLASKMKLASGRTIVTDLLLLDSNPEMVHFANHWKNIPKSKRIIDTEEGIMKMMYDNFAYHDLPEYVYPCISQYFDQKMICHLSEIHWLRPTRAALYANDKGHLIEIGKIGLMKIFSTGLLKREQKRTLPRKPYCQNDMTSIESVTIYEAAPIIFLLMSGIVLSIVICVTENIVFYLTQSKQSGTTERHKQQSINIPWLTKSIIRNETNRMFLKKKLTTRGIHDHTTDVTNK